MALMTVVPTYLKRFHGLDLATAQLCAVPGALSFVVSIAMDFGADVRRVALMQTMRLALLMIFIPLLADQALGVSAPKQAPHEILTLFELFGFIGALAVLIAKPLGVPSQIGWLL